MIPKSLDSGEAIAAITALECVGIRAELVLDIPQQRFLINVAGQCVDESTDANGTDWVTVQIPTQF